MIVFFRESRPDAIPGRLKREAGAPASSGSSNGIGAQILLDLGVREMKCC